MTQRKTYHRAVDGIRRILAADTGNVYLSFRLLKQRSLKEIHEWGLNVVGCKPDTRINSVMTTGYSNFVHINTADPLPFGAEWVYPTPATYKTQCFIPILGASISANGDVSVCTCVGAEEDLFIGSIKDASLGDLYNSPRALALWDWAGHGIPASCAKCSFYVPIETVREDRSILHDPFQFAGA